MPHGRPGGVKWTILGRGARGDESTPGYGLGLAAVQTICLAYGGRVEIAASPLGGALVRVTLPG